MTPTLANVAILGLAIPLLVLLTATLRTVHRLAFRPRVRPLLFAEIACPDARLAWEHSLRPQTHPAAGRALRRVLVVAEALRNQGDDATAVALTAAVGQALESGDLESAIALDARATQAFGRVQ